MLIALKNTEERASRRGPASRDAQAVVALTSVRSQIRRRLRRETAHLAHLAAMVEIAVEGPDPEAALVYLKQLHGACSEALAASLRR